MCRGLQQAIRTYFLRWGGSGQSHPSRSSVYRVSTDAVVEHTFVKLAAHVHVLHCMHAGIFSFYWIVPQPAAHIGHATVDQLSLEPSNATGNLWAGGCSHFWLAISPCLTASQLLW